MIILQEFDLSLIWRIYAPAFQKGVCAGAGGNLHWRSNISQIVESQNISINTRTGSLWRTLKRYLKIENAKNPLCIASIRLIEKWSSIQHCHSFYSTCLDKSVQYSLPSHPPFILSPSLSLLHTHTHWTVQVSDTYMQREIWYNSALNNLQKIPLSFKALISLKKNNFIVL